MVERSSSYLLSYLLHPLHGDASANHYNQPNGWAASLSVTVMEYWWHCMILKLDVYPNNIPCSLRKHQAPLWVNVLFGWHLSEKLLFWCTNCDSNIFKFENCNYIALQTETLTFHTFLSHTSITSGDEKGLMSVNKAGRCCFQLPLVSMNILGW